MAEKAKMNQEIPKIGDKRVHHVCQECGTSIYEEYVFSPAAYPYDAAAYWEKKDFHNCLEARICRIEVKLGLRVASL